MAAMSPRIQALARCMRSPVLRGVELSFLAFSAIEQAVWIGLLVFAYRAGGVVEAGLVAGLLLIPAIFAAPFIAGASDRWPRDRIMALGYLGQAACMVLAAMAIFFDLHRSLAYLAIMSVCTAQACSRPAVAALLPAVARDPHDLGAANAATSMFDNCGALLGPLLAALALSVGGPATVFAASALIMAASGFGMLALMRDVPRGGPLESSDLTPLRASLVGGLEFLSRERDILLMVSCAAAPAIVLGALDVLVVAVASESLGDPERAPGLLLAAFGSGGLMGAAATIGLAGRRRLIPAYALGVLLLGVPIAGLVWMERLPFGLALLFAAGVGESFAGVSGMTLIQRTTPDRVRGRVFGVYEGLYIAGLSVGALGVSALSAMLGLVGTFVAVALLAPAFLLVFGRRLGRVDAAAHPSRELVVGTLGGDPILAPLPDPSLDRLAQRASIVRVPRDAYLIHEGETADRYYRVLDGELDVRIGDRVVRRLMPGDSLGEVALVRGVPRTASIVAVSEARLLAMDRADFLEAVGDSQNSRERAESTFEAILDADRRRGV